MPVFNNILAGASGSTGGAADYKIERSLRFNDDDQAYLSKNIGSVGDQRRMTFSFWVKRHSIASSGYAIFAQDYDTSPSNAVVDRSLSMLFDGDRLELYDYGASDGSGNSGSVAAWTAGVVQEGSGNVLFRDPSAWYSVIFAIDTTQSTAANRCKVWINGVQRTMSGYPVQNSYLSWGQVRQHYIGIQKLNGSFTRAGDFSLADVHFIDGQQLSNTDFGAFDATTGVWNPIRFTGNHGTNGFHLDFSDNSSNAALGYDAAGSNNWTVNNLVAQGPTATQFKVYGNASTSGSSSTINVSSLTTLQGTNVSTYSIGGTSYNHLTADLGSVGTHAIQARTYLNVGSDILVFVSNNGSSWSSISNQQDPYIFTGRYIQWVRTSQGYDNQVLTAVSAESATDSLLDSPTNYEASSGNNGGNYATLNPLDALSTTLSNGNLTADGNTSAAGVTGTIGVSSGKWYYEATVGSSTDIVGIWPTSSAVSGFIGDTSDSYGYFGDGQKLNAGAGSAYGSAFSSGDIIGVALDLDNGTLVFYKNNVSQGSAFTGLTGAFRPAIRAGRGDTASTVHINFGQRPFAYTPPTGFKSLCTQNFDDPTITKPSEHFDVVTYDGTGQAQAITGLNFQPDIAWIKERNGTSWHRIIDSVRGQKELFPNDDNTEVSFSQGVNSFTSDGFNLGTGSDSNVNTNSKTYVGWLWKAATSFSNGSGSNGATLASSGKVNQAAGISIVTYSYTGTSQYSYVHGLNVKPDLVLRKARNLTESWSVYHSAMGFDERSNLDNNNASSGTTTFRSDGGDPTSTLNYINNNNTSNVVEYVFTAVPGFSAFGRYEGTGTNDGPFIFTGFKPRFILLKNVDNYGTGYDWFIHDTKRDPYNVSDSYIKASQADTEQTYNMLDILSNGFKLRNNLGSYNQASHTHVWAAFAENPFKYARAR